MHHLLLVGFSALAGFSAGVVFAKTVLSDVAKVKAHVTQEIASLKAELKAKL